MDIAIIVILGILILIFRTFKMEDYFSPWLITVGVWFVIMLLFQIEGDLLYPLKSQFFDCLYLWLVLFISSSLITFYSLPKISVSENKLKKLEVNLGLFKILYVISMILTPLYMYQIYKVISMFDMDNLFYNLRILAIFGDNTYGFLQYSYILNQILFVVSIWIYPKVPLWQLITIIVACLLGQFAIMEKSGIFFLVLATLFILYEKKNINIKSIIITLGVIFLVFFFINVLLSSGKDNDSMTFIDFFAIYVLSPSVAFGYISEEVSQQLGSHTFQIFYLFLNRFGANFEINQRLQDFIWIPLPTNVYTVFEPFFRDFGYRGVAFFAFLYGTLSGWLYRCFKNGGMISKCVYAYIIKILIMQFYNEDFIQNIVLTGQFIFFITILISSTNIKFFVSPSQNKEHE